MEIWLEDHMNLKDYDFPFFNRYCTTTDDSYMTVAVGRALQNCINNLDDIEALKKETICNN